MIQTESISYMPTIQHQIPVLPSRPRIHPVQGKIIRSYSVGRQNYSRACQGEIVSLSIKIDPENNLSFPVKVNLITTMNSVDGKTWNTIPFSNVSPGTFLCKVEAVHPGVHSFRTEFSFDNGNTWMRDAVADAWIQIDPRQTDALRMYTLIPNVSGSVADWIKDLIRIKAMGFNAVHILPLTTLDISESPYSAKDLFNIDPRYLSDHSADGLAQLEEFTIAAKKLGIRLCFDLVLNHVGVNSNIARQAPDWIIPDPNQPDGFQRAKYLTDQGWYYWDDLILINYEHPSEAIRSEIWAYMTGYMLFWAKYANATGGLVRFDNLHSSNPAFILSLTKTLRSVYPEIAILAEYFTDEATLVQTGIQWGINLNLATPWDYKFVPKLREYLKNIHRLSEQIRYFMPVTSHDSGSPAQEFGGAGSTIPRYVAAALLGTGATGIVQGVEFGIQKKIEFIGRKPKIQYPENPEYAGIITRINSILAEYPAFRNGFCHFVDNDHPAVIAAFRMEKTNNAHGFLVVCNFDIHSAQNITVDTEPYLGISGPVSGMDLLNGQTFNFPGPGLNLKLKPCSAMVLKFS